MGLSEDGVTGFMTRHRLFEEKKKKKEKKKDHTGDPCLQHFILDCNCDWCGE